MTAGQISIASRNTGGDGTYFFTPAQSAVGAPIDWTCTSTHTNWRWVPADCRVSAGS